MGDVIAKGLGLVGITDDKVTKWIGQPCGCRRRRQRLNKLSDWAWSIIKGEKSVTEAKEELDKIVGG